MRVINQGLECSVDGCVRPARVKLKCKSHYDVAFKQDPAFLAARTASKLRRLEALMGRSRPSLCEACGGHPDGKWKVLYWDHDHATSKPRGWICHGCNVALGLLDDSTERLEKLAAYLKEHG